jgi:uncharacterized protein (TIGR02145 family)
MKTLDINKKFHSAGIRKTILVVMVILIFITSYSCREDEQFLPSDGVKETSLLKKATIIDCESQCINPGNPVYFEKSESKTVTWGNPRQPKINTVEITFYNTLNHFILKVISTSGWSDLVIDGISSWVNGPVSSGVWGEYSVELPSGWSACDDYHFSLQVAGNGPPALFDVQYNLIGECKKGIFTDERDGNTYNWVQIGNQIWMAENLNYGTSIDGATHQLNNDIIEKYCLGSSNNDCNLYGGLYQWNEMMNYTNYEKSRGICPEGWHIPDKADWQTLLDKIDSEGYFSLSGKVLKSSFGWITYSGIDGNGTDIYGFCALPGGAGGWGSPAYHAGCARFWSSTPYWNIYIEWWQANLSWYNLNNLNPNVASAGMSVRCIKD